MKNMKPRTIKMYRCESCTYTFGTPWFIKNPKSHTMKQCTACGSRRIKFLRMQKL